MHIHCLQHVAFENPGTIAEWALANRHSIGYTYFFEKDVALPGIENTDALSRRYDPGTNQWIYKKCSGFVPVISYQIDF